jgi:CRP-like cAMP-binding protein
MDNNFFKKEEVNDLLNKIIKAKKGFKFLHNLDDDEIKYIIKDLQFIKYKMHEVIIKEGTIGDDIYILIDGECRINVGKNTVGKIRKGEIFGEFAPITKELRTANIMVKSQSANVLSFKIDFDKFEKEPVIFAKIYQNITHSLIDKFCLSNIKR